MLGCVRDSQLLPNMYTVCAKEGFKCLEINYIGGMWVWIEFKTQRACKKFI